MGLKLKFIEVIKDYFAPAYSSKFSNPEQDAKILSQIGMDSLFLNASNGRNYYYYFPKAPAHLYLAQYLLRRNGINVRTHNSRYFYDPRKALRIPKAEVVNNQAKKDFIESIDVGANFFEENNLNLFLREIRSQMQGKTK